ncbi:MAG: ribonuclease H-like domain-containing protein [Anaerolineae bacterium]
MAGLSYVAFDIEIAKEIPDGCRDWSDIRPLGISCAATLTDDGDLRLWYGEMSEGRIASQMTPGEVGDLVAYLRDQFHDGSGRRPLTWNGLGFDFDVLAEEAGDPWDVGSCRGLALDHIDMGFQMFCEKGFMAGLNAAAKGMGLAGKTEGMHGDLAPVMWAKSLEEQKRVLEYVAQDVRTTAGVYEAIIESGRLTWLTKAGRHSDWMPTLSSDGPRMLTVRECLALPVPDTSWLKDPWPRSKFTSWLGLEG